MTYSIIIDPGHGGNEPGTSAFGVTEKDWNLKMSLYQYQKLRERGVRVGLTRSSDQTVDYVTRSAKVKDRYDFCLSNHFNASGCGGRGVEGIYSLSDTPDFAADLVKAVAQTSGLPVRRVFTRRWGNRDYYFMHRLTGQTRTVILEYGFLDHRADFNYYANERNFYRVADAVVDVIARWCKPRSGKKTPAPTQNKEQEIVQKVIRGDFGNGQIRRANLRRLGYDPVRIQRLVNKQLGVKARPLPRLKQRLHLPKSASRWRVYRPDGPYTIGSEIGYLAPAQFGGLTYKIEGSPRPGVYHIQTRDFGRVAIYAASETGVVLS